MLIELSEHQKQVVMDVLVEERVNLSLALHTEPDLDEKEKAKLVRRFDVVSDILQLAHFDGSPPNKSIIQQ